MKLAAIQLLGHMESVLFVNVPKENLGSGSVYATMHCRKISSLGEICFSIRNPSVHVLFVSDDSIQ